MSEETASVAPEFVSKTVPLTTPIDVDGSKLASITVRPPRTRDLLEVRKLSGTCDNLEMTVRIIARLSVLTYEQVGELSLHDLVAVEDVVLPFLPKKVFRSAF